MLNKFAVAALASSILLGLDFTLSNSKAAAWFQICNKTSRTTWVAFTYLDVYPKSCNIFGICSPARPTRNGYISKGWWVLAPTQCVQTYPHDLKLRSHTYYLYAKSTTTTWEGNDPKNRFWTLPLALNNIFSILNAQKRDSQPNGTTEKEDFRYFLRVDTGNNSNTTVKLTE
jgi:uncharacterized membrane protein